MEPDKYQQAEKRDDCSPRRWIVAGGAFVAILAFAVTASLLIMKSSSSLDPNSQRDGAQAPEPAEPTQDSIHAEGAEASLTTLIIRLRKEKNLIGLAAIVAVDGKIVASAADGERKKGSGVWLKTGDRFHLGSITKSITATMIARLIESGQLKWSTSIGECFPDASIHDDWKPVTFQELLTHTSGAPPNFPIMVAFTAPALGPERTKARREAVLNVLAEKPTDPPGEEFEYSNVGFTIAGAMAEQATGQTWEDLVKREVFEPLKLVTAGFGPPKSPDDTLPQPRGHRPIFAWKTAMGDDADNTPIIGPAGTVHMSLGDLCTYATEHLRGDRGEGQLLSAETYKRLHAPKLQNYACGWVTKGPGEIPLTVFWHNGSNTLWYALVVFIPEKNMVVAVASNDGDIDSAESAAWEVLKSAAGESNAAAGPPQRQSQDDGDGDYDKKSPFAAVRWQESQPEVKVGDKWFTLVSLDDLPASEIVAFSQRTFGDLWQKRFEEDLVEVLTRMGHEPEDTVQLVVMPLESQATRTLGDVPMTRANRQAIWDAAQARERSELEQPNTNGQAIEAPE